MTNHRIILIFFLNYLVKASFCNHLCRNQDGNLSLIGDKSNILAMEQDKSGNVTVFLKEQHQFTFSCNHFQASNGTRILFEDDDLEDIVNQSNRRVLEVKNLYNDDYGSNTEKYKIQCENVCSVSVIVIKLEFAEDCNLTDSSVHCKLPPTIEKDPGVAGRANFAIEDRYTFVPIVKYSVFDPLNGTWVPCDEIDDEGVVIQVGKSTEDDTESINCPLDLSSGESRPVIIRREEYKPKNPACVAMPKSCQNSKPEPPSYSYFSHQVNGHDVTIEDHSAMEHWMIILVVFIALAVVGIAGFLLYKKFVDKSKDDSAASKFYVDSEAVYHQKYGKDGDNNSMKTETTMSHAAGGNYRMSDFINISDEDILGQDFNFDASTEEGQNLRKKILSRQLSGDPKRFNPDLALNHQAPVLAYNSKYEIDRSNFEIGKLLGSGNFGCVYEGLASGIFHPGSKTKVAVKTFSDALDQAQFTALLCEIKVLGNLELHLNLVNMLGSCKSDLQERGELWLLLEFCPHGDLKDFLIKHREEFLGSINNKIAISGLDERLFFKWAHSIAKGMEYLSIKKIMHGDLAARNILIGGLEGGPENYVAKVSDFGLSKTFYDNISYKKQNRDVPWKWMALEYLQDGMFTMKSDVWSFGVVLWEILSLGQEPYAGKDMETAITEIKQGSRLPCPDILGTDLDWLQDFYQAATYGCWQSDPGARYSFTDLVGILETYLTKEELIEHQELNNQYKTMRDLINDDSTRLKRMSSTKKSADDTTSYQKVNNRNSAVPQMQPDGYLKFEAAQKLEEEAKNADITANSGYITITQAMT